ncbi:MAG TPA: RluA family pseudouridine synthase [Candidatus Onthovivens sp.]|nr:RluA family pseudouridine synthase [Candidatus Onthovivens sp.]
MKNSYVVGKEIVSLRLDKALTLFDSNNSREFYSYQIKEGNVKVNGEIKSPSYKVKEDDVIDTTFINKVLDESLKPYELELDIVYEDDDLLIIDKPRGLVVHPGSGHHDDTLVNALIYNKVSLSNSNGMYRVGIVHRIDKDTSGLLLVAKNDFTHERIANQLKDHSMHREYIALVEGIIEEDQGKIVGSIGRNKQNRLKMAIDAINGKNATTYFEVVKRYKKYTLIKCRLETGRTHQIRVHLSSISHPIVGDGLYGGGCSVFNKGQLLHAYKLTFVHPRTKKEMSFERDIPLEFNEVLETLK